MKKILAGTALLSLLGWAGTSWGAVVWHPGTVIADRGYTSWTEADTFETWNDGETHAYAVSMEGEAEARADDGNIGVRTTANWDEYSWLDTIYAQAEFSQEFEVVGAGHVDISFSFSGSLSAEGSSAYDGSWTMDLIAEAGDALGNFQDFYQILDMIDTMEVNETFQFSYDFTADQVGETFALELYLQTMTDYSGSSFEAGESLILTSNFYNSLQIDAIDETPVPVPGAVWLLGSGFAGLVGMRGGRKKTGC